MNCKRWVSCLRLNCTAEVIGAKIVVIENMTAYYLTRALMRLALMYSAKSRRAYLGITSPFTFVSRRMPFPWPVALVRNVPEPFEVRS